MSVGDGLSGELTVGVSAGGHAYDVLIGAGLLARLGERCGAPATQAVVVCDEHVAPLYLERVLGGLESCRTAGFERRSAARRAGQEQGQPRTALRAAVRPGPSLATTRSWPSEAA